MAFNSNLAHGADYPRDGTVNRDEVLERLPQQILDAVNNDGNENIEEAFDNSFLNLLRAIRYGDSQNTKRQRPKIQVSAGKSIKSADFESTSVKEDQEDNDFGRHVPTMEKAQEYSSA